MTRYLLWLVFSFVALLPGPAAAQGFGFPGPAQGSGGGSGDGTVDVSGSGITGDGSTGDPLALAAVLEALVDGGGTATAGAGTVLDLTTTGGLAFGTGANDVRLAKSATNVMKLYRGDGTDGATLTVSASGVLAFGTTSNDVQLAKGASGRVNVMIPGAGLGDLGARSAALYNGSSVLKLWVDGTTTTGALKLASDYKQGWSSTTAASGTIDTSLSRDAAGRLLVGNGSGTPASLAAALNVSMSTSAATLATFLSGEGLSSSNTMTLDLTESAVPKRSYALSSTGADYGIAWQLVRYRGTVASPAAVTNGDLIASIQGRATGSAALGVDLEAQAIKFEVDDGSVGAGDVPGRITFWTTADGSATSSERWRIGANGNLTGRSTGSQIGWTTGLSLGGSAHILGPTDDVLHIASNANRNLELVAGNGTGGSVVIAAGTGAPVVGTFTSTGFQAGSGSTGNAWIPLAVSAASTPAHSFVGDTDTGLHRVGADTPSLVAAGKNRVVVAQPVTLPDNTATTIATIGLASGEMVSANLMLHILITDGTDKQSATYYLAISALDKAGTLTTAQNLLGGSFAASTGTITGPTIAFADGTNTVGIQVTVDSTLTSPTITCSYELSYDHSATHTLTIP